MKRYFSIPLSILSICLNLTGCGGNSKSNIQDNTKIDSRIIAVNVNPGMDPDYYVEITTPFLAYAEGQDTVPSGSSINGVPDPNVTRQKYKLVPVPMTVDGGEFNAYKAASRFIAPNGTTAGFHLIDLPADQHTTVLNSFPTRFFDPTYLASLTASHPQGRFLCDGKCISSFGHWNEADGVLSPSDTEHVSEINVDFDLTNTNYILFKNPAVDSVAIHACETGNGRTLATQAICAARNWQVGAIMGYARIHASTFFNKPLCLLDPANQYPSTTGVYADGYTPYGNTSPPTGVAVPVSRVSSPLLVGNFTCAAASIIAYSQGYLIASPFAPSEWRDIYRAALGNVVGYSNSYQAIMTGSFDPFLYMALYPDVVSAGYNTPTLAVEHYLIYGVFEGRRPSYDFDPKQMAVLKGNLNPSGSDYLKYTVMTFAQRWLYENYFDYNEMDPSWSNVLVDFPALTPSASTAIIDYDKAFFVGSTEIGYKRHKIRNSGYGLYYTLSYYLSIGYNPLQEKPMEKEADCRFNAQYYINRYPQLVQAGWDANPASPRYVGIQWIKEGINQEKIGGPCFTLDGWKRYTRKNNASVQVATWSLRDALTNYVSKLVSTGPAIFLGVNQAPTVYVQRKDVGYLLTLITVLNPSLDLRLEGDFNGDGAVSQADYNIFHQEYLKEGYSIADLDFNGIVSQSDYNIFKLNYLKMQ